MTHTKSRLLLDLSRGAQRVSPVCCGLLLWFRWARGEKVDQSPHGRDGHAPFFSAAKSNFKGQMVSAPRNTLLSTLVGIRLRELRREDWRAVAVRLSRQKPLAFGF